jgi:uncharacterized protein
MASGFFALLDDIAALMDDVVVMSKITTKKTAGILGDDLAVNAKKASGFVSSREIPLLWAITKGSFLNKLIILPFAFLLSAYYPPAIKLILILGGLYLAYEGTEKIYEFVFNHKNINKIKEEEHIELLNSDISEFEKRKVKSAVFTDFILSVEIVIIALGTVLSKPILFQVIVVSIVALIATIGVYGIVALIVRMDDLGFRLIKISGKDRSVLYFIGRFLVNTLPIVIKSLAVIGTIALILVAGGIFVHNIEMFHDVLQTIPSMLRDFLIGLAAGFVVLIFVEIVKKVLEKLKNKKLD